MTTHSKLDSPSKADQMEACPGSVALTMHLPDTRSAASDQGTLCHWLSAEILSGTHGWGITEATEYLRVFPDGSHDCPDVSPDLKVTQELCEIAQYYVDYVRREAVGADLMYLEARVVMNEALGVEEGAEGTADALIFFPDMVKVIDLKAGFTPVSAETSQLKRYALGARETFGHMCDAEQFKLVIVQPKLDYIGEVVMTSAELDEYAATAKASARLVRDAIKLQDDPTFSDDEWNLSFLNPGEKQCRWCKAKAWCPALSSAVESELGRDMENIAEMVPPATGRYEPSVLAKHMNAVGMVEDWCKAVRAAVEGALVKGEAVPGFKLVQGRRGARAWSDAAAAEALMRNKFRLKVEEAYDLKLISPTKAEKILGEQPKRWAQLEKLITQSDGKPSVAPESDKRPAISVAPSAEGMDDLTGARFESAMNPEPADALADLLN